MSIDFYVELLKSSRFCESLGRLLLLSGKLESALKNHIVQHRTNVDFNLSKATLGQLKGFCEKENILSMDLINPLQHILLRRNYLTHNLYSLFNDEIEVTLLPKEKLEPEDANHYFPQCVEDLISDIEFCIEELNS